MSVWFGILESVALSMGYVALPLMLLVLASVSGLAPASLRQTIGNAFARTGYMVLGSGSGSKVAHIQSMDGDWYSPRIAKKRPEIGKYVVKIGDAKLGFDAGAGSASFLGAKVLTAYEGFGLAADAASANVARSAKEALDNGELKERATVWTVDYDCPDCGFGDVVDLRKGHVESGVECPNCGVQLSNEALDIVAEELDPDLLNVEIPSFGAVNLADIRFLDKYNYSPELVEKIESYTKASQSKFAGMSGLQQAGALIGLVVATMLFTWWITTNSGGGGAGGGGMSLPFGMLLMSLGGV